MPSPHAAVYAALKAERDGLTLTGLEARLPHSRPVIRAVLQNWRNAGHVLVTTEPLRPGDTAPARRFSLKEPNP